MISTTNSRRVCTARTKETSAWEPTAMIATESRPAGAGGEDGREQVDGQEQRQEETPARAERDHREGRREDAGQGRHGEAQRLAGEAQADVPADAGIGEFEEGYRQGHAQQAGGVQHGAEHHRADLGARRDPKPDRHQGADDGDGEGRQDGARLRSFASPRRRAGGSALHQEPGRQGGREHHRRHTDVLHEGDEPGVRPEILRHGHHCRGAAGRRAPGRRGAGQDPQAGEHPADEAGDGDGDEDHGDDERPVLEQRLRDLAGHRVGDEAADERLCGEEAPAGHGDARPGDAEGDGREHRSEEEGRRKPGEGQPDGEGTRDRDERAPETDGAERWHGGRSGESRRRWRAIPALHSRRRAVTRQTPRRGRPPSPPARGRGRTRRDGRGRRPVGRSPATPVRRCGPARPRRRRGSR